jgi:hypothetical protein
MLDPVSPLHPIVLDRVMHRPETSRRLELGLVSGGFQLLTDIML